jgi:hypothetical protein
MTIEHPEYQHQLEIDDATGLPVAVTMRGQNCAQVALTDFAVILTVGRYGGSFRHRRHRLRRLK